MAPGVTAATIVVADGRKKLAIAKAAALELELAVGIEKEDLELKRVSLILVEGRGGEGIRRKRARREVVRAEERVREMGKRLRKGNKVVEDLRVFEEVELDGVGEMGVGEGEGDGTTTKDDPTSREDIFVYKDI